MFLNSPGTASHVMTRNSGSTLITETSIEVLALFDGVRKAEDDRLRSLVFLMVKNRCTQPLSSLSAETACCLRCCRIKFWIRKLCRRVLNNCRMYFICCRELHRHL